VLATVDPGGSRLTTLTERGGRTRQAVAEFVWRLVARGYLDAVVDPTDGRAQLFHPTPRTSALPATCERVIDDYGR
jgi:DNA-binding MarR family transcriptional regulator